MLGKTIKIESFESKTVKHNLSNAIGLTQNITNAANPIANSAQVYIYIYIYIYILDNCTSSGSSNSSYEDFPRRENAT